MLLLYMTVGSVLIGSATAVLYVSECYGRKYSLPFDYTPYSFDGKLYFTPNSGGPKKLLLENGEKKDPRLQVTLTSSRFFDRTERNGGMFSVSIDGREFDVIHLQIKDCARKISRNYGNTFQYSVSREVDVVEFIPMGDLYQSYILWNRTDPQTHEGGRGRLRYDAWQMSDLTQLDDGYYNFWIGTLLRTSILLTVEAQYRRHDIRVNDQVVIDYPLGSALWTVTFIRDGKSEEKTLLWEGNKVTDNWRVKIVDDGILIGPLVVEDSGTYEFRDSQGNLAKAAYVDVHQEPDSPTILYIVLIVVGVVVTLITCCCCVKKCCCKKSSSKKDESTPHPAEAPAVYYHDGNQGEGYAGAATPAYSYQPMTSPAIGEPAASSTGPSEYHPVDIHVTPPQPEPAAPGGTGNTPPPSYTSNFLSSDPGPTFELKGMTFPSAPPFSSDSTSCDVYTSDKLNFL